MVKFLIGMGVGSIVGGIIGALYEKNKLPALVQAELDTIRPSFVPIPTASLPGGLPAGVPAGAVTATATPGLGRARLCTSNGYVRVCA